MENDKSKGVDGMDKFDPKKFYKFVRYDTGAQMYGMGKTSITVSN